MDVDAIAPLLDKGAYIGIGALVVWAIKSGWLEKQMTRIGLIKKEIQEEAKEAPERELRVVKEAQEELKVTVRGLIAELKDLRLHNQECEVKFARAETKIEVLEKQNGQLTTRQAELTAENAQLKDQIQHLQTQAGVWHQVQVDVKAIQKEQGQQSR